MRRMVLLAACAALVALSGCRHRCHKLFHKDDCCPAPRIGTKNPTLLPPAGVPTTPGPSVLPPGTSGFLPPGGPAPAKPGGPDVLFPDPLPQGAHSHSSRPGQPDKSGYLSGPVKPAESPKAAPTAPAGATKVKDGLFAGRKPTLDGFDALKAAGFRTVVYLHAPGADVAAAKDVAATRDLTLIAIETTPEALADASAAFDRAAGDRLNRPVYVYADDDARAGAVWYLHFRNDALSDDVARLRAKALGLTDQGDEGKAFALAIQKVLEGK
ncbi:MAG: hypothetical protein FJ304_10855 [Planctomycetes bacterium]|nr:hypothetical protein [Planctomycetota bacterium]